MSHRRKEKKRRAEFEGPIQAFKDYGQVNGSLGELACLPSLNLNHLTGASLVMPRRILLDGSSITPSQDQHKALDTIREEMISYPSWPSQEDPGKRASSIRSISRRLAHKQLPEAYLSHIYNVLRYSSSSSSSLSHSSRASGYSCKSVLTVESYGNFDTGSGKLTPDHSEKLHGYFTTSNHRSTTKLRRGAQGYFGTPYELASLSTCHTKIRALTRGQERIWNELIDENMLEIEVDERRYVGLPSERRCCAAPTILLPRPFKHGVQCAECGVREAHCKAYAHVGELYYGEKDAEDVKAYLDAHRWDTESTKRMDYYDFTPLHCAACVPGQKNFAAIRRMIRNGAATDISNTSRQSFLHLLCLGGFHHHDDMNEFINLLKDLRQNEFNFKSKDHNGRTALHNLFRYSAEHVYSLEVLRPIFSITKPDLLALDSFGCSILQYIETYCQNKDIFESIYTDFVDSRGWPSPKVADSNQTRPRERKPRLLRIFSSTNVTNFETSMMTYELTAAVALNAQSIMKELDTWNFLGNRSKHMKEIDIDGNTLLSALVKTWKTSVLHDGLPDIATIVHEMIKAGANIHARDRKGDTVLAIAASQGMRQVVIVLLNPNPENVILRSNHCANVNCRNNSGISVLNQACKALRKAKYDEDEKAYAAIMSCCTLLIDAGAQMEPTEQDEWMSKRGKLEFLHARKKTQKDRKARSEQENVSEIGRNDIKTLMPINCTDNLPSS